MNPQDGLLYPIISDRYSSVLSGDVVTKNRELWSQFAFWENHVIFWDDIIIYNGLYYCIDYFYYNDRNEVYCRCYNESNHEVDIMVNAIQSYTTENFDGFPKSCETRQKFNGRLPELVVPFVWSMDDFGRAKRGKYNPLKAVYFSPISKPGCVRALGILGKTVTFSNCMNFVTEEFNTVKSFNAYNAALGAVVKCKAMPFMHAGDNCECSKLANHMGPRTEYYCRRCLISKNNMLDGNGALRNWTTSMMELEAQNDAYRYGLKMYHSADICRYTWSNLYKH